MAALNDPAIEVLQEDFGVDFGSCLWQQRLLGHKNDLTLLVGQELEHFDCNAFLMMARSRFLRRVVPIYGNETSFHQQIEIPEVTPDEFRGTFYYLYTDDLSVFKTVDDFANGLYGGKRMEHPPLVVKCRDQLLKFLDRDPITSSLVLYKHTERFLHVDQETELFNKVDEVLQKNARDVLASPSFAELPYDAMSSIVSSNSTGVSPLARVRALNGWAEETLKKKQVLVNSKAKMDLTSEVLLTIPLQTEPFEKMFREVESLDFLSDELLKHLSKYHTSKAADIPFFQPDNFDFISKMKKDGQHHHDVGEFCFSAVGEWTLKTANYKDPQTHTPGFLVHSDPICTEEDGTIWRMNIYPCGENAERADWLGLYVESSDIDKKYNKRVHAHYSLEIVTADRTLVHREGSRLYQKAGNRIGYLQFVKLSSLPQECTVRARIQWTAPRPVFWLPASRSEVDGAQVATVSTTWKLQKSSAHLDDEIICSPLFGRDGILWSVRIWTTSSMTGSQVCVQLRHLPDGKEKVDAVVTVKVGHNEPQTAEEKMFTNKLHARSKDFECEKVDKHVTIEAKIQYKMD